MITCISLSKEPLTRDMPSNMVYLNHVSTFSSSSTMNDQMLLAVSKVDTPYFFFCDSDDPIPKLMLYPQDKGIVYGDFYIQQNNNLEVIKMGPWSRGKHLHNPLLIHKPVAILSTLKLYLSLCLKVNTISKVFSISS